MALTNQRLKELFAPAPSTIDLDALDPARIPSHIAVIMDGNGRWAQQRGLKRAAGHKAGIKGVRALIRTSNDLGVRYLTIYSFSTENWSRPLQEVKTLMTLFANTMAAELAGMHKEHVRIRVIGDLSLLPARTRTTFEDAVTQTANNTGMTLVIAVNYGSRQEILSAVQAIARAAAKGDLAEQDVDALDPAAFSTYLQTAGIPDPDLLIRTSGEYRLSNFLLYQIAYSELYVTSTLWPDFDKYELLRAIIDYQQRERRFGGV
ncbi:MAG: isoprenyl transferase [Coriobacteriales bacterium]|nr:isoprenyl transferase [Coriobacteriales bacterium]